MNPKQAKILGLALGLPSTILVSALALFSLAKKGILGRGWAIGIFIAIIVQFFVVIIRYAKQNRR